MNSLTTIWSDEDIVSQPTVLKDHCGGLRYRYVPYMHDPHAVCEFTMFCEVGAPYQRDFKQFFQLHLLGPRLDYGCEPFCADTLADIAPHVDGQHFPEVLELLDPAADAIKLVVDAMRPRVEAIVTRRGFVQPPSLSSRVLNFLRDVEKQLQGMTGAERINSELYRDSRADRFICRRWLGLHQALCMLCNPHLAYDSY